MSESLSIRSVVGDGYDEFWTSKKRYVVCKGSRASKKSTTAALKIIVRMMQYPKANTLVVRQTYSTLKDSCYTQLRWAQRRLGVEDYWTCRISPLEMEYKPTGQKILFRGLDDPLKVTSVTVSKGVLCWGWLEEAYEADEAAFDRLDESLRGQLPKGYYIQWLITFNPWDSSSWLKARFFDQKPKNVLAMTTNYLCNEWLSDSDKELFEQMKVLEPQRYKVAGLGEWGVAAGQFFSMWDETKHVVEPFDIPASWLKFRCMDWGSSKPYCCLWCAVDYDGAMYVYKEAYGWGGKANVGTQETAQQVGKRLAGMEKRKENVSYGVLDSACWAKTGTTGPTISEEINAELLSKNLVSFGKCSKGRLEAGNAIKQRLIGNGERPALFVFANCVHLIRTLPQLGFDKYNPEVYDTNGEDHAVDALAYGCMSRPYTPLPPAKGKRKRDKYRREKKKPSVWAV